MVVDECRHEGDGEGAWALSEDLGNLLVLEPYDILTIDFSEVVVNQDTIPMEEQGRESITNSVQLTGTSLLHTSALSWSPRKSCDPNGFVTNWN